MKHIHKFLYACFSFIVNTFYNPNSVFGGWSISIQTPTSRIVCNSSSSEFCFAGTMIQELKVRFDKFLTSLANKQKSCSASDPDLICEQVSCDTNWYVSNCTVHGISNEENCITDPNLITSIACKLCPDGGMTADSADNSPKFYALTSVLTLCSHAALTTTNNGDIAEYNTGVLACRKHTVTYHSFSNFIGKSGCYKNTHKDTDKTVLHTDEKGEFSYTDKCYIDEE